jgi:hypothetical protein
MARHTKAQKEARWVVISPALSSAWRRWRDLFVSRIDIDMEADERALFDLNPVLYSDYRSGETPHMRHLRSKSDFVEVMSNYLKEWGMAVVLRDLESYMAVKISHHGG